MGRWDPKLILLKDDIQKVNFSEIHHIHPPPLHFSGEMKKQNLHCDANLSNVNKNN